MTTIGTAGHVDHGKSALVQALTGIDPDRLAEEKSRGMTIDLGFSWVTLPSGRDASIVDVPGHEAFIRNMLAGASGIDLALFVVAADEGIMPQTREHLAILDLLRVSGGVIALTKADLVEADWLEFVREEVVASLEGTCLSAAPIIACSAKTRQGLPDLLAALDTAASQTPSALDRGRPRLPVDRVFTMQGFGTVVTGTLAEGPLRVGQEVSILPSGKRARIRGLQAHKHSLEVAHPGGRVAVNLAGVATSDLSRGDVLSLPGLLASTDTLDVSLHVLADAPRAVTHNSELDLFVGAAEVSARVNLLESAEIVPGQMGWAQFRLARPIVANRGDRFILRAPSPSLTVGGGQVVDPASRRSRKKGPAIVERLRVLAQGDPEDLVLTSLTTSLTPRQPVPILLTPAQLSKTTGLDLTDTQATLEALQARGAIHSLGVYWMTDRAWQALRAEALELLAGYHVEHPTRWGMAREEWRSRLRIGSLEAAEVQAALHGAGDEAVVTQSEGTRRGGLLRLGSHEPHLPESLEAPAVGLLARYEAEPFAPPDRVEALREVGSDALAFLIERGDLIAIGDEILFGKAAYAEAVRRLLAHMRGAGRLSVAEARDLLGATRKYVVPLLEHLDRSRLTVREGDDRVLGPAASVEAS